MEHLNPAETALVLIDLQAGILRLPVVPHSPVEVVSRAARLAADFREARGTVALVRVAWAPDFADAPKQKVDVSHAYDIGADWADFAPELAQAESDIVITKRQWGAFHGTELDLQLRRRGIKTIVLAGIASNMGVESTARAAWELGYELVVLEDVAASFTVEMHDFAMKAILPMIGRVCGAGDVVLESSPR